MSCSFESLVGMQVSAIGSVNTRPPDLTTFKLELYLNLRQIEKLNTPFKGEIDAKEETSLQIIDKLCKYIYAKDVTDRLRTQVIFANVVIVNVY